MKWAWGLAMAVVAACLVGPRLESCGPFLSSMLFTTYHGALPGEFEKGRVGVLRPHFYRRDLLLAYRTLSGIRMSPGEAPPAAEVRATPAPAHAELWLKARGAAVADAAPERVREQKKLPGSDYQFFENCLDGAFDAAAATLQDRVAKWGAASPNVAEWVRGQDQVFQNCTEGESIPRELTSGDALLAADRRYQIGAAQFYAGQYDTAEASFDRIAADGASPWHEMAPYLAARACIRNGTIAGKAGKLQQAEERLRAILKDPARKPWHAPAQGLLDFVRAHLEPGERLIELGELLMQPDLGPQLERVLTDYTSIWDRTGEAAAGRSDVADWISSFQGRGRPVETWRAKRTAPWLVAALVWGDGADEELMAAARAVQANSPAWASVTYWGIRRQILAGETVAARQWADQALAAQAAGPVANLLRSERLKLASDWREFLTFAPRTPAAVGGIDGEGPPTGEALKKKPAAFDLDSVTPINEHVPLSLWADAIKSDLVPRDLQCDLARAGWVRAVLLDDAPTARTMAVRVAELTPELAGEMKTYLGARDARAAKFAAVFLMLRGPGFEPVVRSGFDRSTPVMEMDSFRDNWWNLIGNAGPDGQRDADHEALYDLYPKGELGPAGFLTSAQRAAGDAERKRMKETAGNAVNFLGAEAIAWAQAHAEDPRVPESLHRVVEATHYGPADGKKSKEYSQQAFDILHRRYPSSEWTKKTKYWY